MRRFVLATIAMVAVICPIPTAQNATADEGRVVRQQASRLSGPRMRTAHAVRMALPRPLSRSLFLLYAVRRLWTVRGTRFWGAFTFSGWGYYR